MRPYGPDSHATGKPYNKLYLQELMGLPMDSTAPVCFWPTRLDGSRPGWRLMADTLGTILERYREQRLQVVFVAEGDCQDQLRALIDRLQAGDRVAVSDFDARRYRLAYGGSPILYLCPCTSIPAHCPAGLASVMGPCPSAMMQAPSTIVSII